MSEDRLILAIGRLERGLARIEAMADRPPPPAAPAEPDPAREAQLLSLTHRHDRLKGRVESAIASIDAIIAKG